MTFAEYLNYFLSLPALRRKAAHLLSDEQYICLLELCMGTQTVTQYCDEKKVSAPMKKWLYRERRNHTYEYVVMEYTGKDVSELDKGPVLVCFVQPDPLGVQGQSFIARPPTSNSELLIGTMRRCVPVSQIVLALDYCHRGGLYVSHHGMDTTEKRCNREFWGITRALCRLFVKRCTDCQLKQPRQHKAAIVPILAKALFERIVIDLIDYSRKPSHGYKWILHACDHFSKCHWAYAMPNKESASVAHNLELLFQQTGPVKVIQSDNGTEFLGDVGDVLERWGMADVVNGSPYHPQTQGLVERYNRALKEALDRWMVQENSQDWYMPLSRIVYQLNCTAPRTTRQIPYELVHAMQPPAWLGLRWQGPLSEDNLSAAFAACVIEVKGTEDEQSMEIEPAANAELTFVSPSAGAIDALTALATQTTSTQLHAEVAASRPPIREWQPPIADPRPLDRDSVPPILETRPADDSMANPKDWRGRPLFHPPRSLPVMQPTNDLVDLQPGKLGPLHSSMAIHLNVAGLRFYRFGVDGGGRCLLSAFLTALGKGHNDRPLAVRRAVCDEKRAALRLQWEVYNKPERAAGRTRMRELVFNSANSGRDHEEERDFDPKIVKNSPEWFEALREEAWEELGKDFNNPARSLGWDALVWLGTETQVNIILFPHYTQYKHAQAGSRMAITAWKATGVSDAQAKKKAWSSSEFACDPILLPCNRVFDSWPFIVLVHRTELTWRYRKGAQADDPDQQTTEGGSGHYEPIVTGIDEPNSYVDVVGCFSPTRHQAQHAQLLAIGKRLSASANNAKSTERMAQDHDASSKVHEFKYLDAVAVRIKGKKPRSGDTTNSLPGLVIGVHRHEKGNKPQKVVHQTYTVWTVFGVLDNKLPVDSLNKLSLNNFPDLLDFKDNKLTDAEQLPTDDENWTSPINRVTAEYSTITLKNAWSAHLLQRTQRPVDQSRHRTTASRPAATAADTAIAATQADTRSALSLNTVSDRPASRSARGPSPSRIVAITGHTKSKYKVVYSQPAANPHRGDVTRTWMDKRAEYVDLVKLYWDEQSDAAEAAAFLPKQQRSRQRTQIVEEDEEQEEQQKEEEEEEQEEQEEQEEDKEEQNEQDQGAADEMDEQGEPHNDEAMDEND